MRDITELKGEVAASVYGLALVFGSDDERDLTEALRHISGFLERGVADILKGPRTHLGVAGSHGCEQS